MASSQHRLIRVTAWCISGQHLPTVTRLIYKFFFLLHLPFPFVIPAKMGVSSKYLLLVALAILVLLPTSVDAFGAGNIASISKIEGKNWRHGDIEDMLATVACLKGHKWKSQMIKVGASLHVTPTANTDVWRSVCTLVTGYAITHR